MFNSGYNQGVKNQDLESMMDFVRDIETSCPVGPRGSSSKWKGNGSKGFAWIETTENFCVMDIKADDQ